MVGCNSISYTLMNQFQDAAIHNIEKYKKNKMIKVNQGGLEQEHLRH